MNLRQLRYLVAVADESSFTRGAALCNISQPPLSRAIAQLEREIGVRLFDRDRHRVTLTAAGASLLEDARRILDLTTRSSDRARSVAQGISGTLTLAFGGSAVYALLPALVRRFRRAMPHVNLVFKAMPVLSQIDALRNGDIDLGIIRLPVHDEMIETQYVYREPLVLAVPVDHALLDRPGPIAIKQLAGSRFITYEPRRGFNYRVDLQTLCRFADFEPTVAHEASTTEAVIGIVACGEGVAIVPASARRLHMRGVAFRGLDRGGVPGSLRTVEFALAWHRDTVSPSATEFVRCMARRNRLGVTHSALTPPCADGAFGP